MKRRIAWVDAARGFGILLVILGHSYMAPNSEVNKVILSFHMPLFFFLSGLCTRESIAEEAIGSYLARKARSLLMPQFVLGMIFFVWDFFFLKDSIINTAINSFTNWFLIVLFWVDILYYFMLRSGIYKKKYVWGWIVGLYCTGIITDFLEIHTLLHVEMIPMALCFFVSGVYVQKFVQESGALVWNKSVMCIVLLPILILGASANAPVRMYENTYENPILFLCSAVSGIILICALANGYAENKYLTWIGRNSIYFYVFHYKLLSALRGVFAKLFHKDTLYFIEYPRNWGIFLIAVVILTCATVFSKRYLYFLFGEKKIIKEVGYEHNDY